MNRRHFITLAIGTGGLLGLAGIPLKRLARVERKATRSGVEALLVLKNGDLVSTPNFPRCA